MDTTPPEPVEVDVRVCVVNEVAVPIEVVTPGKGFHEVGPGIVEVKLGHWMMVSTEVKTPTIVFVSTIVVTVALGTTGPLQAVRQSLLAGSTPGSSNTGWLRSILTFSSCVLCQCGSGPRIGSVGVHGHLNNDDGPIFGSKQLAMLFRNGTVGKLTYLQSHYHRWCRSGKNHQLCLLCNLNVSNVRTRKEGTTS